MEKTQINQTVLRETASHKNRLFAVLATLMLLGVSLAVSMALLGESLGRFLRPETNVIPLIPPSDTRLETDGGKEALPRSEPEGNAKSPDRSAGEQTFRPRGELDVFDDQKSWGSETQVDLFRGSYDGTVVSGDGEKVIAPGTSNYYGFALKNNGNIPLDYTVSLKVEPLTREQEADPPIPLEWRLLDGERTAVSDWQTYNNRERTLKAATLAVRRQDNYTIEWRWGFEQNMDGTDTQMGNAAVERLLGAKATITVSAEQSADWDGKPTGPWWLPQTGDTFNMPLYLAVLAVSGGGLLLLLVLIRRGKKDRDEDQENMSS